MKIQLIFMLAGLVLISNTGWTDENKAEQNGGFPFGTEADPLEPNPFLFNIKEFYSFQAYGSRIVLGMMLRPDLIHELARPDSLLGFGLFNDWTKPHSFLDSSSHQINQAVRGLVDTPRVFSISIEF